MMKLVILGSSNAVASDTYDNTHMVLVGKKRMVMIDCVSSPIIRLRKAGLDFQDLTDLLLTHLHPDHVSGVPILLMGMWLLGRKRSLNVYGITKTIDGIITMMNLYNWSSWPNFFPVTFHRLPEEPMFSALSCDEFEIKTSPVKHIIPTIGVRIENRANARVLAYSCDTEPCPQVVELAHNADILIHEAAGASRGHSSARQAAEIALEANARQLYLIHYPTWHTEPDPQSLVSEASEVFNGEVGLTHDYLEINI